MKTFFSSLFVVLFATNMVAQSGLTCADPIPVDSNYVGTIDGPCTMWYSAWTYDLPLTVHFAPDAANSQVSPKVYVDFSCTPGEYDDPKLSELINDAAAFGVDMPIEFECDRVFRDGKYAWDLPINKSYREQMTEYGITYNVQAFVKVIFEESGSVRLSPDTAFSSCMNNSEYVRLGDTIDVLPNDSDRVFLFPYPDWQQDSIRFVWLGEQQADIWLALQYCEFTPNQSSSFVWDTYAITKDNPYKLQSQEIIDIIKNIQNGGLSYAKILAPTAGKLVVEKIPMTPVQGGATLLEYGKPVELQANDNRLFCFPKKWKGTEFEASTNYLVNMYVSNSPEFTPSANDANVLNTFAFSLQQSSRVLQLSTKDISRLATSATDDYLYVRFQSSKPITITPVLWDASACANQSILLQSGKSFAVPRGSKNTLYRLPYADWEGFDISVSWNGARALPSYMSGVCDFELSADNPDIVYKSYTKGTTTIPVADIDLWAPYVGDEGFLFVRFNPSVQAIATFTSTKIEEEPTGPTTPCGINSIQLKAGDQIVLNLDSAFTVYSINYKEWINTGATLAWSGADPLHTFVAETCVFALAPYNRYVLAYVPVPANGDLVLDAALLAAMEEYVDEDGFLYIRFLTKSEGTLTVQ